MANIFALHEKGPKDLAEDYRPISLTSVCCKTLEHIVYSNVCKFLDSNNILTPKQHGFRPGFSCETVKHSSFFLSTIGPGPWIPASVVMLPSSISVRPLTLFLIPDFLASCITMVFAAKCLPGFLFFLLNRYQRDPCTTVHGSQSSWSDVISGVPQGTVLGPLLFLLYINDIAGNIQSNIRLFADDCIVCRCRTIRSQDDSCKLQNDISSLL